MRCSSTFVAVLVLCVASCFARPVSILNSDHPELHTLPGRRTHAGSTPSHGSGSVAARSGASHEKSAKDASTWDGTSPGGTIDDAKDAAHDDATHTLHPQLALLDKATHELRHEPHHDTRQLSEVLLQRSAHHRRHAFRQPKTLEGEPTLIWGLPKLMWVILADIVAVFLFLSCIPLIMFLSKRRRPNFGEEKEGCCPSCFDSSQPPVDRMGV